MEALLQALVLLVLLVFLESTFFPVFWPQGRLWRGLSHWTLSDATWLEIPSSGHGTVYRSLILAHKRLTALTASLELSEHRICLKILALRNHFEDKNWTHVVYKFTQFSFGRNVTVPQEMNQDNKQMLGWKEKTREKCQMKCTNYT